MLNHITIMGRLTRDPEIRTTQTGVSVASFTLAVDRDFKDKQTGEKATDFIDCVAWRSTAEFVSKYFTKGRMAVADGRLQLRDWVDNDGNKRRSTEVLVSDVYFGDAKKGGDGGDDKTTQTPYPVQPVQAADSGYADLADVDDEELPF